MHKTLHKRLTVKNYKKAGSANLLLSHNDDLESLLHDMKPLLEGASGDLLQPRREAIDAILKKASLF